MNQTESFDRLAAVVVGSGFGCRIMVPALRATGFDVVGLVGTDKDRTRERADLNQVPLAYTELTQAIVETGAKLVCVATPPPTHCALVLEAIRHGYHILCEKPFAMNLLEAQQMLAAAEEAGVVHCLGYEFRWDPPRAMAQRLLAQGAVGDPKIVTLNQFIHYAGNPYVNLPDWWLQKEARGGWLGAWGSHVVDWIHGWLGDFARVSASLPNILSGTGGAEDSYLVFFELANGATGTLTQSSAAWGPSVTFNRVAGTSGSVWLDGAAVWRADAQGTREVVIPQELIPPPLPALGDDPRRLGPEWQMMTAAELPLYIQLARTLRARIEGGCGELAGVPLPTSVDGAKAMAVLDAIRQSAANGGAPVSPQYPKTGGRENLS